MNSIDRRGFLAALGFATTVAGLVPFQSAWAFDRRRPARARKLQRIVIDAGHGGIDPGCIGCIGTYEKNIVLSTALDVARRLEASGRYKVFMSRSNDTFVTLENRVAHARAHDADLFLSIHADALPEPDLRGASVYTLSEKASDKQAAAVAAQENGADVVDGINFGSKDPEVDEILFDLTRRETNNMSIRLARGVVGQLGHDVKLLPKPHRSANFVVLRAPDIPSALVEIGCLSNRREERDLRQAYYRSAVAGALVRSVDGYFDTAARV